MTKANDSSREKHSSPIVSELSSSSSIENNVHTQRELSTLTKQQSQKMSSSELSSELSSKSSSVRTLSSIQISLIAGSCAGITSTIGVYPMDVLRTKMQQQTQGQGHVLAQKQQHQIVHGPLEIFRTTIQKKNGGIRALYTGITMPLLAQTIYKSTVFTISNITQQYLVTNRINNNSSNNIIKDNTKPTLVDQFIGGFIGGGCNAALFVTPVEFIRNQLIAQNTNISSSKTNSFQNKVTTLDVIKNTFRHNNNGILGLWRGISWTIYRDSLGCGCFFYTMAYCQQKQQSLKIFTKDNDVTGPAQPPSIITTIVSSGIAGLAYWIVALPLDTIKTWVQSADISNTTTPGKYKPLFSVSTTIQTIYNQHGIYEVVIQLFRGWQFAYFRGIPSAAITMTTYSIIYRYLSNNGYDTFTS